ncbi:MAG: hypothetical protein HYZ57_21515 [Acidobacteria bacterium]|nr:hypothetical protein [Acidobacteriota bacterium]MBI3282405.1 hypothetical protein [Acidobacteriota bacterium]
MQFISREEIRELAEISACPCVSIYMPEHRTDGPELRQNPVRFKNLLRQAEQELSGRAGQAAVLQPARELTGKFDFWVHPGDGLAVFAAPDGFFRTYHLPARFEEIVRVNDRFYIAPLLQTCVADGSFHILAISQNKVRLFFSTRYHTREAPLPASAPKSLAEAMKFDDPEKRADHLRANPSGKPMFHGHNTQEGDGKIALWEYFRQVDNGVRTVLRGERGPLVFAGVEFLFPIYKDANTYPNLIDDIVAGNPDELSGDELRGKAFPVIEPHLMKKMHDDAGRYGELAAIGRASRVLEDIVTAASGGRVDALFIANGIHQWGVLHPDSGKVRVHHRPKPGDEDLVDVAALQTILHGGRVYSIDRDSMPVDAAVAAVYRY